MNSITRLCYTGLIFLVILSKVTSQITTLTGLDTEITNTVDDYFDKQAVIPIQTITNTMGVSVDMHVISVNKFDDDNERIEVSGYLTLTWTEERLTRTASALTSSFTASSIWTPALTLINCACTSTDALIRPGSTLVKMDYNTGVVVWKPWFYGTVLCEPNMKYFPFDEHKCLFKFTPTDHTSTELLLTIVSSTINQDYYNNNNEWTIEHTNAKSYVSNSLSFVEYELTIKRKPQYIVFVIVVPIMIISLLNVFVFHVTPGTSQRLSFSVKNLLGIIVLFGLSTFFIPRAAVSMSLIMYFMLSELLINVVLVGIVILSEGRRLDILKFLSVKLPNKHNHRTGSTTPRSLRRIEIMPRRGQNVNVISIDNEITSAGIPQSAWDDDDDDVNDVTKPHATVDENTGEVVDLKENSTEQNGETISSFDMICFCVLLFLQILFSVSFLTPLGMNL